MAKKQTAHLPGLYKLPLEERLDKIADATGLEEDELRVLQGRDGLTLEQADHMIENVVGLFGLPLGIATNFIVNGREVLIPMVIEEPSVVAGASFMAKLARTGGGFHASTTEPEMIAQLQVLDVPDLARARTRLMEAKPEILSLADEVDPVILQLGGGARDVEIRLLHETPAGPMMIVHVIFDTRDAMGANVINTVAERLAPKIEELTGGRVNLRILSNLADRRLARTQCRIPADVLAQEGMPGEQVRDRIVEAWAFAASDPYRAATHNKGIMNGIDAVVLATGNDWRAIEAGAHAYAARDGKYTSLSEWHIDEGGELVGELEMPMAAGIVGGATRAHPAASVCLKILGVKSARELAEIIVSVGLAQNLAALRALATEGIQRGHMSLHAKQIAITAGAKGQLVEKVAQRMIRENVIRLERAQELVRQLGLED
jgi:hydroxymethylglutaryl-CoA reductase